MSDLRLEYLDADQLAENPANWRTHSDEQMAGLQGVLDQVGWAGALLYNERTKRLIDGHARKKISKGKVPVLIGDWSEDEEKVILATLDPLASMAEADEQKLGELLATIETESDAVQAMLEELAASEGLDLFEPGAEEDPPEPQIDRAAELQKEWGTESGQLWVIGEHRLLCGDSTKAEDVGRVMGEEAIGAVVTDPPYGCNVLGNKRGQLGSATSQAGIPGRVYTPVAGDDVPFDPTPWIAFEETILWGGNWFAGRLPDASCWLVWDKREGTASNNMADCELAWTNLGGPSRLFSHRWMGMIRASENGADDRWHPTQKPASVMRWCIEQLSGEGTIFDPFLGSGTTMVAAQQLNRRCFGIEISPGYVAVCLQRMKDLTGETPVLET